MLIHSTKKSLSDRTTARPRIKINSGHGILLAFKNISKPQHDKFLLRGHTHLEVYGSHSMIERARKKTMGFQIMTPWDWQQLARMCSINNPFEVINMETNDFKDFKHLYQNPTSPFISRKKREEGDDFAISKVVFLQVRKRESGTLFYKTDFTCEHSQSINLMRSGRHIVFPDELSPLRSGPNVISTKKYKHLQNILTWIPKQFHDCYKNLVHTDLIVQDQHDD